MSNYDDQDGLIPEIEPPIIPEPREIRIWPGRFGDAQPILLEPISEPRRIISDPPPPELMTKMTRERIAPKFWTMVDADGIPCVDEVSNYVSFRFGTPVGTGRPWGIVVSSWGFDEYVSFLRRRHKAHESAARLAAWRFIVLHQVHHFLVDRAVATMEAVDRVRHGKSAGVWERFHHSGVSALEESSCCAYALRCAAADRSRTAPSVPLMEALLAAQPAPYRQITTQGSRILTRAGDVSHQEATSELLSSYVRNFHGRARGLHGLLLYGDHKRGIKGDPFFGGVRGRERLSVYLG